MKFTSLSEVMAAEYRAGKARKESNDPKARDYHNAPHGKTLGRPRPAPPTTACTECGESKRWHPAGDDVCVGCQLGRTA